MAQSIGLCPDGTVGVPVAPGSGIQLDADKLENYGERFFEITSRGIAMKTMCEKGLRTAPPLKRNPPR